ncbi:hypothetical protein BGZ96_008784 [Linnemannia gamsii]|uniref:Uncharacterized protein n=1 Tax=Linnemannia gamsii TaxID=64522 RepID=A0ABQ7JY76_9FUNG|nr:hypothetical protein BGZ96_008784 [Linnemannia gamsii]
MSRATNAPTWTPSTTPEVEVKLEKVSSTKEKNLSSKSTSTSHQDNRKSDTSAAKATKPLSPRTTPAPQEMTTLESPQTRRRCSGLKSNRIQCLKVCKTGYPEDVPFFCMDHITQADSFASPIILTPATSPEAESKNKDKVEDKIEDHGEAHKADAKSITYCSGTTIKGVACKNKTSKRQLLGAAYFCRFHKPDSPSSEPTPTPAPVSPLVELPTPSPAANGSSPSPSKQRVCDGVTAKGDKCKNKRPSKYASEGLYYCSSHKEQSTSMDGVILQLDFVPPLSPPTLTAPRVRSGRIKNEPKSSSAPLLHLEEPKVEKVVTRSSTAIEALCPTEIPSPTPGASVTPGIQTCHGLTKSSAPYPLLSMPDPSFRTRSPPQTTGASTETEQAAFEPDHLAHNHRQQELSTPPAHSGTEFVKVVSTISIAEKTSAADIEGTVSESDSTTEDAGESAIKDAVDDTTLVKPTTDAVGQSNIVANDNDSTAPTKATAAIGSTTTESASATAEVTDSAASSGPGVDTKDAAPLSIVEVATEIAAAIDATTSSDATASSKKTHTATNSTVLVDTAASSPSEIKEENVTHVSVTEGASASEKPTTRQKGKKIELTIRKKGKKIEPTEENDISKTLKEDLETTTADNVLKIEEDLTPITEEESLKEKEAVQEAVQEPEVAQEPEVTQEIRNTCSYVNPKKGTQCVSRVLTVREGPFFCQDHHRHGQHGEFVFSNEHISILLEDDFEALAESYPENKRRELQDLIEIHFQKMFQSRNIMENSIGGLNNTITDSRKLIWIKRGFLYVMDYIRDPEEEEENLALKIGSTTGGKRFRDYFKYCEVRGKDSSGKFCHPVAIFPSGNNPADKGAKKVLPFIWLFEKIIHCIYKEVNYNTLIGPFKCKNKRCTVKNHKEVHTLSLLHKSRQKSLEHYRVKILANMGVWSPFLKVLEDKESLINAFQNTLLQYTLS